MLRLFNTQFGRFAIVGLVNTALDTVTYSGLIAIACPVWLAIIVSTSLGLGCSFVLNRRFSFSSNDTALRAVMVRFLIVTLSGLWLLQPAIVTALSHGFGLRGVLQLTFAKLLATGVTLVWNFYWYRRYVFMKKDPTNT